MVPLAMATLEPAPTPSAMLLLPLWLLASAPTPMAVLLLPMPLLRSALLPMAVLSTPLMLLKSAKNPSRGVAGTAYVVTERCVTDGRVAEAYCVIKESECSVGGVLGGARVV